MNRSFVITVGVVIALTSGGAGAVALIRQDDGPVTADQIPAAQSALSQEQVNKELAASYSVFRRPRSSADDAVGAAKTDPTGELFGANAALSRQALTTAGGDRVFAVPSRTGACLFSESGRTSTCSRLDGMLAGDTASVVLCSPTIPDSQIQLAGFLPDGASDVRLGFSDGTTATLEVVNNVYVVDFKKSGRLPTEIRWRSRSGDVVSVPSSVPRGADRSCG